MTTTPSDFFLVRLTAEEVADLFRGRLQVISHLTEGWTLGLIGAEVSRKGDAELAEQLPHDCHDCLVFWLGEQQLLILGAGGALILGTGGRRFQIVVDDVEELDELLDEDIDDED